LPSISIFNDITFAGSFSINHNRVGSKPAPETPEEQQALIDSLQTDKTRRFKELVETSAVCRPGVLELMDEALADPTIAVGVCSASTKEAAQSTLSVTLGQER
jgi:beta-phosphoglucomutase-like phosphatase (HAD superfamily)